MDRQIEVFTAADDAGTTFSVRVIQSFVDVTHSLSPQQEWKPGMKRYLLSDGRQVNAVDNECFEIASTGKRIRRL